MSTISFIALDCEWANRHKDVCSIGITIVLDSNIIGSKNWYVLPQSDNTEHLGTNKCKVIEEQLYHAKTFPEVWAELSQFIKDKIVICHNAKSADMDCFVKMIRKYNVNKENIPDFTFICSKQYAEEMVWSEEYSLSALCKKYGIEQSNHHDAMDDSLSCAKLMIMLCNDEYESYDDYIKNFGESFIAYYNERYNYIEYIDPINLNPVDINPEYNANLYKDQKICISGEDFKFGKFLTRRLIKNLGGKVFQNLCKKDNVDILIYSKSTEIKETTKRGNAKKWGIKEISEKAFFESIKLNKIPS